MYIEPGFKLEFYSILAVNVDSCFLNALNFFTELVIASFYEDISFLTLVIIRWDT